MNTTPTPRTDAVTYPLIRWIDRPPMLDLLLVDVALPRQLERELAIEQEKVRVLRNACDEIMQLEAKWPRWEHSCLYSASVTLATDALVDTSK